MFIPLVLVGSLLVALARGGRLANLTHMPLHHMWFLFIPFLLQVVAFSPIGDTIVAGAPLAQYLYAVSLALAALGLALNRQLPGAIWIALGLALNSLVTFLN